jgi:hypothetical protein
MNKICFVIMGFGLKSDPFSGRTLDLDKTYINIIQPAVVAAGLECIRADEIQESTIIDKSMYALLIHADLVIADISTYSPNAVYELGIRHATRPYSTIIIKENQGKIPFDLDHTRIFMYDHMGDDIGATEAIRCQNELQKLIFNVLDSHDTDSPLYEHIRGLSPAKLPEEEYTALISKLASEEKYIFALRAKALAAMDKKDFIEAAKNWLKASFLAPNEDYFIQQRALCTYKSEDPSPKVALTDALLIINELNLNENTTDPETLGITGAIYKNLYRQDHDTENLRRAIEYYQKCYLVRRDYYTGENYAHCMELLREAVTDEEEKTFLKFAAKKVRTSIISSLETILIDQQEKRIDQKWIYATLSNCNMALGFKEKAVQFEKEFIQCEPIEWEMETFEKSKHEILTNYKLI